MLAVIIAGGVGERFWPLSRRKHPKQLLDLTGRGTMIDLTVRRLTGLCAAEDILVITSADQRDAVLSALDGAVPEANVIGEPMGQNTAPCIGLGALLHKAADPAKAGRAMIVLPADHLIESVDTFRASVQAGAAFVEREGCLLTFGVPPTRPETGYGYIETGAELDAAEGVVIRRAAAFHEKPSPDTARGYVSSGNYFWNSGMFMWTADAILEAIQEHLPELSGVLEGIGGDLGTQTLSEALKLWYPKAPSVSIDYGVMEKADNVVVLEAAFDWNDVGSWEFLRDVNPESDAGNVSVGGSHIFDDASNNTVVASNRLVAVLGVDDLVVVDSDDAILVCRRDRVQEVKKIVQTLRSKGRVDLT